MLAGTAGQCQQQQNKEEISRENAEQMLQAVMQDEKDHGLRQFLNLGHTFGHAIEACSGYGISHGKAVAMGMTIITKTPAKKKNTSLTYAKMETYISLLEDAEKYQAEFKAVCAESLAMKVPYVYVSNWFKKTFPNYGKLPERNAEMKIVNTPANYDAEEAKIA